MSKRKTHEQFVNELQEINPSIIVIGKYKTAITKIRVKCAECANVWDTKPSSLLCGRGCPECGKRKIGAALRKSNQEFISELAVVNPNIVALEEYKGNRERILLRCQLCGNEWKSAPHDLLSGHGCPKCGYERQKNAQRHSNDEFLSRLSELNPDIEVLDEYVNNHTKIRFQCRICGKQWKTVPNSVLSGHGCPSCARSSTSFLEQVILNAFSVSLGNTAVISRDRELIGMELDIVVPSLKIAYEPGSWAWHYNKKTRDNEKRKRCREKGYKLFIIYTDYSKNTMPYETDCYTWPTNLGNSNWSETKAFVNKLLCDQGLIVKEEQWADIRSVSLEKSRKKTNDEYITELNMVNPNIRVVGKYLDNSTKVNYECMICGRKWAALPGSVLSGHGCPDCGTRRSADSIRKTHEQFVIEMREKNPNVTILGEYINSKKKILCECNECNNRWEMTPQNLLKGQGCPKCGRIRAANKNRKTQDQFITELQKKNPLIEVIGEYTNSSTKVEVECRICKYKWQANPMELLRGHGCPKCAGRIKKTHSQFCAELKKAFPDIVPLEEYQSANTKISVKCCTCGYIWSVRPHDLLRSKGCPNCRKRSSLERE